jgi:hypothetical protein
MRCPSIRSCCRSVKESLAPQPGGRTFQLPGTTRSATRRRLSAAQPSGLRCQALPRPRCRPIEMAAPVRGRGDARPPACAGPSACRAPAGAAPPNRERLGPGIFREPKRLGPGISSDRAVLWGGGENANRDSRRCLAPQPEGQTFQLANTTRSATRRRLSAGQPSGLRCQALPRPRCRLIEMAAPVRGRGDARPPACAGPLCVQRPLRACLSACRALCVHAPPRAGPLRVRPPFHAPQRAGRAYHLQPLPVTASLASGITASRPWPA